VSLSLVPDPGNTDRLARLSLARYLFASFLQEAAVLKTEGVRPACQPPVLKKLWLPSRWPLLLKGDTKDNKHGYLTDYGNKKNL